MCYLFDILVCPVAEYANEILGFMQAEKMERLHVEFCKFTGCPENNSQPGMLWCYVGQSSFIDTMESFHGEPHLWVPIARLRSSSHPLRIEIWSAFFFGHCCYWVSAQSQNTMWYHILRHLSIEPCYALEYLDQSAIHTCWGKWLDSGLTPQPTHINN